MHNALLESWKHEVVWGAGQVGTAAVGVPHSCPHPPPPAEAGQPDGAAGGCPVAPVPAGGRAVGHHPQGLLPLFVQGMLPALHSSSSCTLGP